MIEPAAGERRRSSPVGALIALAVAVAVVVIGWFRLPPIARGTLWAEDSRLFLQERVVLGPWRSLVTPYDGYQHLVPRVLTDVAAAITTIDGYAVTLTLLALAATGVAAACTYAFTGGLLTTRTARIAVSLVPVTVPLVPVEALGNLANLHWFALFTVPFALLHRAPTRTRVALQTIAVLMMTATEIQTVVFAPLLLLTLRKRGGWPVAGAFLLGLAAQFASLAAHPRIRASVEPVAIGDAVRGVFAEPVLSVFVPVASRASTLLVAHGVVVLGLATLPFVVALAVGLVARWSRRSLVALVLLYGAVVVWAVDLVANPNGLVAFGANGWRLLGDVGYVRYALVPSMFLVALVVVAADRLLATRSRRGLTVTARLLGVVVVAGLVVMVALPFRPVSTARSDGPLWTTSVRQAEAECRHASGAHREKINGAPTRWGVFLHCSDVDGEARIP